MTDAERITKLESDVKLVAGLMAELSKTITVMMVDIRHTKEDFERLKVRLIGLGVLPQRNPDRTEQGL